MGSENSTDLETATSPPPVAASAVVKKKGRRGKKRSKKAVKEEGHDGDVEQKLEEGEKTKPKKVGRGRGRPKKNKNVVKTEPTSPAATDEMQPLEPLDAPVMQTDQVELDALVMQTNQVELDAPVIQTDQVEEETPKDMPQTPSTSSEPSEVVKRRRGGGGGGRGRGRGVGRGRGGSRKGTRKNSSETTRPVVTSSYKNLVDINEITPDEIILPEELVGFEHVEVFNAYEMIGNYKLQDNPQEKDVYPTSFGSSSMQFNGGLGGVSFGMKNSVTIQAYVKTESGNHFKSVDYEIE